jgi:hypothetical protein
MKAMTERAWIRSLVELLFAVVVVTVLIRAGIAAH